MPRSNRIVTLRELKLGGPGLDGYAYNADVYCPEHGREIIDQLYQEARNGGQLPTQEDTQDSNDWPQPIFFGESDSAQHCAQCGEYLYGPQEPEEEEDEEELGDCECSDPQCPHCHGECHDQAVEVLRRVDMEDQSGTAFCEHCAEDASSSGLFDG